MHSPALLFLDEPSTGMDPQNRANLWEHIDRLRERQQTTIVLTTHYLEEADTQAERVLVIDHGRDHRRRHRGQPQGHPGRRPDHGDGRRRRRRRGGGDHGRAGQRAEPRRRTRSGCELVGRFEQGTRTLPGLLRALDAGAGLEVRAADVRVPTLDDVFLSLTGRSLREEAEAVAA